MFIAEGRKGVLELLDSDLVCEGIYAVDPEALPPLPLEVVPVSNKELQQMSALKTPAGVLGVFRIPAQEEPLSSGVVLALDDVRDPGNLGTIIRLCDWFGIPQLLCSPNTVDCYNPKVVQATMGSLSRVRMAYKDLPEFLAHDERPVYIADMDGINTYEASWPEELILVMGNEANGLSEAVRELATGVLSIPRFGEGNRTESLNVATATAILLSEFRRNNP
ncbi:RNA methyltransferase [Robertkochia sediminum]|uniref:RNA methyltransferase n=1 Tax=Robertkochia sediminum TaxID=2785326 RepID=UPI00293D6325|nr:RNA methyltransferase [Robertkochia sediminum]